MKKIIFASLIFIILIFLVKISLFDIKPVNYQNKKKHILIRKNKKPKINDLVVYKSPLDNKFHIARVVALPGDNVEIDNSELFVNSKKREFRQEKFLYRVNSFSEDKGQNLIKKYNTTDKDTILQEYYLILTRQEASKLANEGYLVKQDILKKGLANKQIFPQSFRYQWNKDNFGPIRIPAKDETISLNSNTYSLYKHTFEYFENTVPNKRNKVYLLNNNIIKIYHFTENYYFLLNDNRADIFDSRVIGPISEKNIVGIVLNNMN